MRISTSMALAAMAAVSLLAGGANAQKASAGPATAYADDAAEIALPLDGKTTTLELKGLKTARAAWVTFVNFQGQPAVDSPVITLMPGMSAKFSTSKSCVYEFRVVASPPAVTLTKPSGACSLRPAESAVFRVLAM